MAVDGPALQHRANDSEVGPDGVLAVGLGARATVAQHAQPRLDVAGDARGQVGQIALEPGFETRRSVVVE